MFKTNLIEKLTLQKALFVSIALNGLFLMIVLAIGNYGIQPGDGAELGTVARFYGIAHPTGYPLYTTISRVLFLFFQDGQTAVAVLSRFCWLIGLILLTFPTSFQNLTITRALLHFSLLLLLYTWTSTTIGAETAEVYSLLFLLLAIIVRYYRENKNLLLISFLTGLAISHHWLALGIIPIWLYGLFRLFQDENKKLIGAYFAVFVLGLSVWFILFLRADAEIPVSWDAIEGTQRVWQHITGKSYLTVAGWSLGNVKVELHWLSRIFFSLGLLFLFLAILNAYFTFALNSDDRTKKVTTSKLTFVIELSSLILFLILTLGYPIPDKQGYFFAVIAIIGFWSNQTIDLLTDRFSNTKLYRALAFTILICSLGVTFLLVSQEVYKIKAGIELRERYIETVLNSLPAGTIIFAGGDHTSFPLIAGELSRGGGKPVTVLSAKLRRKEINRLLEKYHGGRKDVPDVRLQLGLVYPKPVVILIDPFSSQHDAAQLAFRIAQARLNQPDTLSQVQLVPRGLVYQLKRPNEKLIPEVKVPKSKTELPKDPFWYIIEWLSTQQSGKVIETAQKIGYLLVEQKRWDLVAEFGIHLRALQLWDLSEWCYRLALQHFPHGTNEQLKLLKAIANLYRDRANVALSQKNESLAISLFEKSLQLDPNHPQTLKTVGLLLVGKNDYENGILKLRKYLELQDDPVIKQLLEEGGKFRVQFPSVTSKK